MRVAILDDIHNAYASQPALERLRARAEVHIFTDSFGGPSALLGFDALIANRERTRFPRALLEQLTDVKIIAQTGVHAYHIDFEAAKELGITVARAQSGQSTGAAELTIGLILNLMRQIVSANAGVKRGEWPTPLGQEISGKTLGIIGLGIIGQQVARLANAFGMNVIAWSRSLTADRARELGARYQPLDELLGTSHVVSVHVPLSPSTRGLVGARELSLMQPTAYLVNTSRGPVVDETALIDALSVGAIAGAGLDVFDQEPLPVDHPLRSLPTVILTPHIGWPTDNAYARYAEASVQVLLDFLDGKLLPQFETD